MQQITVAAVAAALLMASTLTATITAQAGQGQAPIVERCEASNAVADSRALASDAPGVVLPRLRPGAPAAKADYTPAAMQRGVEGLVRTRAVVESDGRVGPVCVAQPLDPDLDIAAVEALRRWRFEPGSRDGQPVAVIVTVETRFTLN